MGACLDTKSPMLASSLLGSPAHSFLMCPSRTLCKCFDSTQYCLFFVRIGTSSYSLLYASSSSSCLFLSLVVSSLCSFGSWRRFLDAARRLLRFGVIISFYHGAIHSGAVVGVVDAVGVYLFSPCEVASFRWPALPSSSIAKSFM